MSERIKILGIFAVLGFVAGILANVLYDAVVPAILLALPSISGKWIISGFTGMILTLLVLAVWAYFSGKPRKME